MATTVTTNSSAPALRVGFGTPFQAQIDFLQRKLRLPSQRWDDIQRSAHDRAFIVAGAAKADLLFDLHQAVTQAIASGAGLEAFRRDFKSIVAKHGWADYTGSGSAAGIAWRTRVIYQTNMATSYAAGRWQQLNDPDLLSTRPYWRYIHNDLVTHPRPIHLAWHGLTLLHDHPFWKTHFPPNGWGCRCRVTAVRRAEGERSAKAGLGDPPEGWDKVDPKTGAPAGIDKGFDYAPGASVQDPLKKFIDQKLIRLDARIGADMWKELQPLVHQETKQAFSSWLADIQTDPKAKSVSPLVGAVDPADLKWLKAHGHELPKSADIYVSSAPINGPKAARHQEAGDAISDQFWESLPDMLLEPLAVMFDHNSGNLVYVFPDQSARRSTITVEFQYARRDGKNMVISGYRQFVTALSDRLTTGSLQLVRGALPGAGK